MAGSPTVRGTAAALGQPSPRPHWRRSTTRATTTASTCPTCSRIPRRTSTASAIPLDPLATGTTPICITLRSCTVKGEDEWNPFRDSLYDKIVSEQRSEGNWEGNWGPIYVYVLQFDHAAVGQGLPADLPEMTLRHCCMYPRGAVRQHSQSQWDGSIRVSPSGLRTRQLVTPSVSNRFSTPTTIASMMPCIVASWASAVTSA